MKKRWLILILIILLVVLFFVVPKTLDSNRHNTPSEASKLTLVEKVQNFLSYFFTKNSGLEEMVSVDLETQVVATGLYVPWSIAWTSPDRAIITERSGTVRELVNDNLNPQVLHTFNEVHSGAEEGLMGLAVDPQYNVNHYLYFSLAYEKEGKLFVKVVRMRDSGDRLVHTGTGNNEFVLIDKIPAAKFHAGSRIKFGPDGKLYITTGDATDKQIAQNLNNLGGKILRINSDGSIPSNNPFLNSPVYTLGHRNPQGLDWQSDTGVLYASEHGPSVFDGPAGGDEVNKIEAGKNYGWPVVSHKDNKVGLTAPEFLFTPAEAPGSGVFYNGDLPPDLTGKFLVGALKGESILILDVDTKSVRKIFHKKFGRIRTIAISPMGEIYFLTSNTDGRGKASELDDRVVKIVPKMEK